MENASKALIIAGAVLVSILIISLGVLIFNSASSNTGGYTDEEIKSYNAKFEKYESTAARGTTVKQLIKDVYQHNISHKDDVSQQVAVTGAGTVTTGDSVGDDGIKKDFSNIQNGKTYKVVCTYDEAGGGLVTGITITLNS